MKTTTQGRVGTVVAILGGLLAADGAWAGGNPADKFKSMDTNGDGMISSSEQAANAQARFAKLDANGDGNLTEPELAAARTAMAEEL